MAGGQGAAAQAGPCVSLIPGTGDSAGQFQGLLVTPLSTQRDAGIGDEFSGSRAFLSGDQGPQQPAPLRRSPGLTRMQIKDTGDSRIVLARGPRCSPLRRDCNQLHASQG